MIPDPERSALLQELARSPAGALITCSSGSMEPTIAVGQSVRVRAIPSQELRVGDVVVYQGKEGAYIMHRIVLIAPSREWFLHIGDARTGAGPRRALMASILGRADRQRRRPPIRVYLQAARTLLRRYLSGKQPSSH